MKFGRVMLGPISCDVANGFPLVTSGVLHNKQPDNVRLGTISLNALWVILFIFVWLPGHGIQKAFPTFQQRLCCYQQSSGLGDDRESPGQVAQGIQCVAMNPP